MRKITIFIASVMLSCIVFGQSSLTSAQQLNAYKSTVNTQIDFEQLSQDLENLATKTPDGQIRCFSVEYNEMLRLKYPSIQNTMDFESWIAPKIEEYNNNVINGSVQKVVVTIPVIMHIIHNSTEGIGTGRNISQAQATSQITILNEDFRKLNADTSLIPVPFKPLAADLEINFVPALRYASNHALAGQTLAQPGIDRISAPTIPGVANTTTGYSTAFIDATIKPNTYWDRTEVMNVWVCQISGGILGYAQFPTGSGLAGIPGGATGANTDGLVLLYTATGTGGVAAAPYNKGRTATHEIGHWFGLRHIWADETACAADDYVTDTPQQKRENYGCPSYPQTTGTGGRCSTGDPSSMFMNYMDYTDDACMFMFTQGQKARVVTVLANSPGRVELPTSTLGSPLVTMAQFSGTPTSIPVGNSVTFTDQSISPNTITTWNWTFTGGTPSSFVGQTPPAITYNAAGNYDVSLTVTDNLSGTDSETKVAYINVFTAGACDTLNFPPPGTVVSYTTGAGQGYLVGNNQYGDLAKAEYFSAASHAPYTFVTGGLFAVRSARDGGNGATVDFNVWDATGAGGSPGAVLGTVTVPLATLNTNPTGFENTIMQIMYPNAINVGAADYFFGFTMNGFGTGDTLGVFSNTDGDSSPGTGWEQWSDNSWNTTTASWGINISQYLSPIMSQNAPTAAITTNATSICAGGTVNFDASTSTNAVGYNWIFNSGSPATSTSTAQTVTYAAVGTPRAYLVIDGNCGSIAVDSVDITVNPNNTVSVASSTPTLCINTALTNITHATTGATGIGAATGLPAGVTANWVGGTITISGTPTASGTFNYSIPLSGGCGTVNATGTITVTPNKTASAASSTPTVCINTAITNITHTTTLATGIGAATGLPAGVTANWAGGTITISGTPTASGTFNYSIPLTGGCGTVSATGTITVNPNVTPTFAAVSAICSGDALAALPTTSTNGITGTWSPALDNTTTTTYTFTPTAGQCATTTTLMITVNPNVTPTFAPVSAICSGDALSALPTTSTNGINGTWSPALDNTTTTTYTFTPTAGQCATTTTLMITVNPATTPTFAPVSAICSGDALSALPTTSTNGINGTWSPALDNTTTTTYTFTPTAGQCATTTTLMITVNSPVTPTFAAVSAICSGDALSPLPTTSTNGINGTWSPALDNTTTTTYTFTPTAGQCATTTTLMITVNSSTTTPTFTAVSAICSGDALSALPTISNNGITGMWSPALDNTTTTTYTFTPDAGQCATTTTLSITVNPNVTPTFAAVSAICSGDALSALPTTSTNGVTGTWSPALDNTTTTTYTFTPDAGQCATTTTLSITVNPNTTPTFAPVSAICSGDALSALPTTSTNGINGTWSPALDNTTTTTYTFTPTVGQCATTTTLSITVNPNVTPTFAAVSAICSGDALAALPTTSTNGVTGTWSPALDNTTTTTYTFTPDAGQCATTTTLSITVNPNVTPTFAAVSAICSGDALSALPTTSTNGITGTWSPALDNTTTTTYTFTPTAGQCATTTTLMITVNPATTPTFAPVSAICSGDALSALPTTSTNGITGTWSPALDNTTTTTYTFTPDAGQCATTTTLMITVNSSTTTPTFTAVSAICSGDALSALPTISNNGITGMWSPALDNTTTTTYTFTPDAGQCAITTTLMITVNPNVTPTFAAVSAICSGDALSALPTTSTNGVTGTWSPALDNTTTTTYTFTPTAGQCATTTTLMITVNSPVTPTFAAVSAICSGDALSALPTTSTNGITGTWSPALDNTTTTTYTFTPDAGQCATTTTLSITVNPNVTPTFAAVSAICSGDALSALPTTSTNGINGTWSPALDNTTTTTYTFTPDAGQCATTTTLMITVNPSDVATISYPQATYCITEADATPTITGLTGGTFSSSPAGLTIDGSTGIIGVSSSTDGAYTVSYTTNGTCPIVSNATIVIDLCTGVAAVTNSEIKVYPNPTSEFLTIETANLSVDKISLMNLLGEKLVEQNTHGLAKTTINVNEFSFGIYLLQLYNADGEIIYTQKVSIK